MGHPEGHTPLASDRQKTCLDFESGGRAGPGSEEARGARSVAGALLDDQSH